MSRAEPSQTPAQPRPAPRAEAVPAPAWRQGDFSAALRQAEGQRPQRETEKQTRRAERPEDDEQAETASAVPDIRNESRSLGPGAEEESENRLESLLGAPQHQPHAAPADPSAPPSPAGVVNTEFAAMLDRLALQAAPSGKGVEMQFTDKAAPLSSLNVARGADGALHVQLSAHAHAASQVNRSLGELKKRLADQGLDVAEVGARPDGAEAADFAVNRPS